MYILFFAKIFNNIIAKNSNIIMQKFSFVKIFLLQNFVYKIFVNF